MTSRIRCMMGFSNRIVIKLSKNVEILFYITIPISRCRKKSLNEKKGSVFFIKKHNNSLTELYVFNRNTNKSFTVL